MINHCEEIAYRAMLENPDKCKVYLGMNQDANILALFAFLNEKINEDSEQDKEHALETFMTKLFKKEVDTNAEV